MALPRAVSSRLWIHLASVGLFAIGCGGEVFHPVRGLVRLDGQPLGGAAITFVPEQKGTPAVGTSNAKGEFTLETGNDIGAQPGKYKVLVLSGPPAPTANSDDERNIQTSETAETTTATPSPLEKYSKPATSDLVISVPSSDGKYVLDLKSQ